MMRQCAWCLHLINNAGERLSSLPLPKLYEASHGICAICGVQWMEQVIEAKEPVGLYQRQEVEVTHGGGLEAEHVEFLVQLREQPSAIPVRLRRVMKMRII